MTEFGPWEHREDLDRWRKGTSFAGFKRDRRFRHCDFCGSIDPAIFLDLIEQGWTLGPTDKNYKAYLAETLTTDEIAAHKARWLAEDWTERLLAGLAADGKTEEEIAAAREREWNEISGHLAGRQVGKFYYQHLSVEQRTRFIALLNERRLTIGYPGHLYVLPYFLRAVRGTTMRSPDA